MDLREQVELGKQIRLDPEPTSAPIQAPCSLALQQVFRVGHEHTRWIVVLPVGVNVPSDVGRSLPEIIKTLRQKYETPITALDYVEYLGRG